MKIVTINMVCSIILLIICLYHFFYQFIQYSQWWHLPAYLLPNIIYSVVLSLLNTKKAVRIQQFRDGANIVLRKHYHTELNQIKYIFFRQHVWIIPTLRILFNFSFWTFLNFNLIPSVKVSGNYVRLLSGSICNMYGYNKSKALNILLLHRF